MSPTQRSKAYAEQLGYTVAIVEKWNSWVKIRQDLFGFIDLLAMRPGEPILAIQTTTNDHMAERLYKILESPKSKIWLSTGNRLEVWGWAKKGPRGKRKLWALTKRVVSG